MRNFSRRSPRVADDSPREPTTVASPSAVRCVLVGARQQPDEPQDGGLSCPSCRSSLSGDGAFPALLGLGLLFSLLRSPGYQPTLRTFAAHARSGDGREALGMRLTKPTLARSTPGLVRRGCGDPNVAPRSKVARTGRRFARKATTPLFTTRAHESDHPQNPGPRRRARPASSSRAAHRPRPGPAAPDAPSYAPRQPGCVVDPRPVQRRRACRTAIESARRRVRRRLEIAEPPARRGGAATRLFVSVKMADAERADDRCADKDVEAASACLRGGRGRPRQSRGRSPSRKWAERAVTSAGADKVEPTMTRRAASKPATRARARAGQW